MPTLGAVGRAPALAVPFRELGLGAAVWTPVLGVADLVPPVEGWALPALGCALPVVATALLGVSLKLVAPYPFKGAPTRTDP